MRISITFEHLRDGKSKGSHSSTGILASVGVGLQHPHRIAGGYVVASPVVAFAGDDEFYVACPDSHGAASLNGVAIAHATPVRVGDTITVGKATIIIRELSHCKDPGARYVGVTVLTRCPSCGNSLPLRGPEQRWHCVHCQADNPAPHGFWSQILRTLHEDSAGDAGSTIRDADAVVTWKREPPICASCHRPLPVEDVPATAIGKLFCPGCGTPATMLAAPGWLKGAYLAAKQFYQIELPEAAADGSETIASPTAGGSVLLTCPNCSGALSVSSETARTTKCPYCSRDVFLADDLWLRLHPVATATLWYVRFEGPTAAEREAEKLVAKWLAKSKARGGR